MRFIHSHARLTDAQGAQDADPLRLLPHDLLVNSRECIREVMAFVLETIADARFAYVIDDSGVARVREKLADAPLDARYSVIVHYHEYLSSQEFTAALSAAHPGMPVRPSRSTLSRFAVRTDECTDKPLILDLAMV